MHLTKDAGKWVVEAEPHVMLRLRRVFNGADRNAIGKLSIINKPDNCRELTWFMDRYPLDVVEADLAALASGAKAFFDRTQRLNNLLDTNYAAPQFTLALPPRDYQSRAAAIYLSQRQLLIADDLGLGKTCMAICSFTEQATLPALVVCYPHLQRQWRREVGKFAPDLAVHIVKTMGLYELPKYFGRGPDVLIVTYTKLAAWAQVLRKYCRSIIFDEAQELRRKSSTKYSAAKELAASMDYRVGLTATPIYNYGGEMFNVLDVLCPGSLGEWQEFCREWCSSYDDKAAIKVPKAFGSYLREQGLMIRRTRADVGRELPALQKITHEIDCDESAINSIKGKAGELARIILTRDPTARGEKMHAAEEFSNLLRQATGIAKAPYVAEFVRLIAESGEKIVLVGWHHAVYEIWRQQLHGLRLAFYTGQESPAAKDAARTAMVKGEIDVLILSLRSGAGLDGLQEPCSTIVFGELDWSPGVIEQCIGRLQRDGQTGNVTAYFLVSDSGADPIMAETLGLKREQVDGIRDPDGALIEELTRSEDSIKRLAEKYLKKERPAALELATA